MRLTAHPPDRRHLSHCRHCRCICACTLHCPSSLAVQGLLLADRHARVVKVRLDMLPSQRILQLTQLSGRLGGLLAASLTSHFFYGGPLRHGRGQLIQLFAIVLGRSMGCPMIRPISHRQPLHRLVKLPWLGDGAPQTVGATDLRNARQQWCVIQISGPGESRGCARACAGGAQCSTQDI